MPDVMMSIVGLRICLCFAEDDLRSWVMDELLLMTWVAQPTLVSIAELSAVDPSTMSVVVIGLDRLSPRDREALARREWRTPVIAIGADTSIRCEHLLGPRLTSRELKQAIRAILCSSTGSRETAVG